MIKKCEHCGSNQVQTLTNKGNTIIECRKCGHKSVSTEHEVKA